MTTPDIIGDTLLILAAAPANGAVATFSLVRWRASRWGRHMMGYMVAVALVFDLGILRIVFGDRPWFSWVRAVAYALLLCMMTWRFLILNQARREGSRDEGEPRERA